MSDDEFQLVPGTSPQSTVPIEPLYSMLHDAPLKSVEYLYRELSRIDSERDLEKIVSNLGITRRKAIEQVGLVLAQRKQG